MVLVDEYFVVYQSLSHEEKIEKTFDKLFGKDAIDGI